MTKLESPRQQTLIGGGVLSAILVIGCRTKPIFQLERTVDGSNSYITFGRNPIKND